MVKELVEAELGEDDDAERILSAVLHWCQFVKSMVIVMATSLRSMGGCLYIMYSLFMSIELGLMDLML